MSGEPRILTVFPPNYKEINARFNVRGKPVLFAHGDAIYNPSRIKIPPSLIAHEKVHLQRQAVICGGVEMWWHLYIDRAHFRLQEELPAHIAEYRQICSALVDVPGRDKLLERIAERLASPLYGNLIDKAKAMELIGHAGEAATGAALSL